MKYEMKDICYGTNSGIHDWQVEVVGSGKRQIRVLVCKYCRKERKL